MNVPRSVTARSAFPAQAPRPEFMEGSTIAVMDQVTTTHRVTYSNRLKVFIGPDDTLVNFLRPLRRLDGYHSYSVNLTRLPSPMLAADITTTMSAARGEDYVECIGSADVLAIELRTTIDGIPRRHILGLPTPRIGPPGVDIPNGPDLLRVYPEEVFDAEHAAEIFLTYFRTDDIPPGFQLREITE